ncbi:hypothetical protein CYY_000766 [Polysphondylium violaceum]|uniref:UEV-domain-containing protein n=1 Tax=Polysphondylium violaceum TaxID=133409 RepID=A0A8J4QAF2_9MYCE|nr:hypothetical protein CYY_000766 [Polysphondylium violaceum]
MNYMYTTSHVDSKISTLNSYLMLIKIYRDSVRLQRDVRESFHLFPNLLPYYGNAGHRGNLIFLKGTIPIYYNNVTYYIPVVIWMPLAYPMEAPMVVLDPTPDMYIVKSHPHVNEQGIVFHPYMNNWTMSSTLGQYIKLLCDTFSLRPPLQQQQQQSNTNTSPPPTRQPPPPPATTEPPPSYNYASTSPTNKNYIAPPNTNSNNSWQQQQLPTQQPPPSYDSSISKKAPINNNNSNSLPPPTQPTDTKPIAKPLPSIPAVDPKIEILSKCTIKLQELLSKYYDTTGKEIENFLAHNDSLSELKKKYELEKQTINQQNNQNDNEIQQLREKIKQLDDWLLENDKSEGEIDVDSILGPKDSLSKQLLKLVSDDSTIEDLLYYLDKALHSNRISLEEYIKNVRSLSRDQFMIKATVKKVQSVIRSSQSPTNSTSSLGPPPPNNSSNSNGKPQLQQLY